jgi:hypothetical protein
MHLTFSALQYHVILCFTGPWTAVVLDGLRSHGSPRGCRDGPVPNWPRDIVKLEEGSCPVNEQRHYAPPPELPIAVKKEPGTFSALMLDLDDSQEVRVWHVAPVPSLSRTTHTLWDMETKFTVL